MVSEEENAQIINVVRRALSDIDPRLIHHGERVAFLAGDIAKFCPKDYPFDPDLLFVLCALHDIGAYKTDEIDHMVLFETHDTQRHAIYGYLFLKHASAIGDYAEAILYHHTDYARLQQLSSPYARYASIIFLADRADILFVGGKENIPALLSQKSGTLFDPVLVQALEKAFASAHVLERLRSGAYMEDVEQSVNRMRFTRDEATDYLRMLVYAIDFRSEHTVTHTANTTAFSLLLAERMGASPEEREAIELGAFLHDVGKIATPVEILEKPGKLTPMEMQAMRQHVVTSERILRGVVDDTVCDIAVRHHEKLNGNGYPRGLTARDLTLPQRIVAVADVLSALTGRRSYKEVFDKERTVSILTGMRDRGELDPAVCNRLFEDYDGILTEASSRSQEAIRMYETIHSEYDALRHLFAIA